MNEVLMAHLINDVGKLVDWVESKKDKGVLKVDLQDEWDGWTLERFADYWQRTLRGLDKASA